MSKKELDINLFIFGEKKPLLDETSLSLEKDLNIKINIYNNNNYSEPDHLKKYYDLLQEGKYFNIFVINYKTKEQIFNYFKNFTYNDGKNKFITSSCYPFYLIDNETLGKIELYIYLKNINKKRGENNKYNSKDIIEYNELSFKDKILDICHYYHQKSKEKKYSKTLNIMLCGRKGTGKSYLIKELLWENRALSKENNFSTKMSFYEHKRFPITFFDFPGFSNNDNIEINEIKNYISQYDKDHNCIHLIFFMLQSDNGRALEDREILLIEYFMERHIPVFFIATRVEKTVLKSFKRDVEYRMKQIKTDIKYEVLKSHLFIIDSSNLSIKNLLDSVMLELNNSKKANKNIIEILSNQHSLNKSYNSLNKDDNYSFLNEFEIIEIPEKKFQILLENMKESLFFNSFSKNYKSIVNKIKNIVDKIIKVTNEYLLPFLKEQKTFASLTNELKTEFKNFVNEENIEKYFPELNKEYFNGNNLEQIMNAFNSLIASLFFSNCGIANLTNRIHYYILIGNITNENIISLLTEDSNFMISKLKQVSIEDESI